ncbi:hypothetical protein WICPIJ_007997 [Wickerhamomyces pijperi]|uniref:Cysteine proteinase 1, mitochondrial n=1 Tax=Wickerhamomyces pijperi TaxID=599730 RepID=A0A9P8TJD5_WICPI|nr:hypothetical protein WICPIJ_007997 [Wickerhamomyces pijperi]
MSIPTSSLSTWSSDFSTDLQHQLATAALKTYNADEVLQNPSLKFPHVFSNVIEPEGTPVTNQKASGRCWLFASLNILRIKGASALNLKDFQLSQTYLFFYDKLEKANYFLEKIIETHQEDVDSRLVQCLLEAPVQDGGQFTMFLNLVEKYGVVPIDVFPDVYSSTASRKLNELITSKLREFAEILREDLKAGKDVTAKKNEFVKEVYRLLTIFLGDPPKPDAEFTWEYYNKDKKYQLLKSTPLDFLKDTIKFDYTTPVSIINDPRNPYDAKIRIQHLNNMASEISRPVEYLNASNEVLIQLIAERIKNNKPVFFGSHTPKFMNKKRGIMALDHFGYNLINYNLSQSKSSRVKYHESLMTHAMVITGVNIDESGNVDRFRVENSWGKDSGTDGYYVMTKEYFEQYCYQIVVDLDEISDELKQIWAKNENVIELPLWDPMGALAGGKNCTECEDACSSNL